MSIVSETRTFDQVLSTTYDYYRPTLEDNIFKGNPLFFKLRKSDSVRYQDGGASIICPLMYGKNNTVDWYEGDDTIDVTVQEGITVAKYPWSQLAASISIDRKTRRMNSGRSQIINLITAKIKQAEMSLFEEMTSSLYSTGRYSDASAVTTASKAMAGLGAICSEAPDSYDVGGIDTSTYTWWQNKVGDDAGTALTWIDDSDAPSLATGPVKMRQVYAWCSKGTGGPPNFGFASLAGYQGYESYMATRQIYRDPEMAKMGFDNIQFRNLSLFWDESYTSNSITAANGLLTYAGMMFLNLDFLHFYIDSQTNFIRTPFQRPINQDTEASLILWMGNLVTSKRSKHGIIGYGDLTEIT